MLKEGSPEIFCDVLKLFEREKVRYVVVGGIAVVLHGYLRAVADLDVVIDPAPEEARRAMDALNAASFVPTIPLPLSLLTVVRMFDRAYREVDVFVRFHIPFEELWSCSWLARVGDAQARVASLEHLLREKRRNGRSHDLQDIEGLLARPQ
jgi:hypothetical protein